MTAAIIVDCQRGILLKYVPMVTDIICLKKKRRGGERGGDAKEALYIPIAAPYMHALPNDCEICVDYLRLLLTTLLS